ncbi:MAG TPA: CBS domain-containing protein [Myxococcaceae bacterium]|nr:CBS domain-containing protein [Myxococcaceae bacterium]
MPVKSVLSRSVETCRPEDTLAQVAQKMSEHGVAGLSVIGDDGGMIAVITDLDIALAASNEGRKLADLTVREALFRDVDADTPSASRQPSSPPRAKP